ASVPRWEFRDEQIEPFRRGLGRVGEQAPVRRHVERGDTGLVLSTKEGPRRADRAAFTDGRNPQQRAATVVDNEQQELAVMRHTRELRGGANLLRLVRSISALADYFAEKS